MLTFAHPWMFALLPLPLLAWWLLPAVSRKSPTLRVPFFERVSQSSPRASGGAEKTIRLWDVQEQKQIGVLQGHTDGVIAVAFSPDGKTLASGSTDKRVRLWDVQEQKQVGILQGHTDGIYSIAFSPDGNILAAGGWDGVVRLWDISGFDDE